MKAREYFRIYQEEDQDKSAEQRLLIALSGMVIEAKDIISQRKATTNESVIAVFKEMELKSISFINRVNETEPFKSEGYEIKRDALKLFMHSMTPEFAESVFGEIIIP